MIQNELAKLGAEGKPIRVGVSGAGWIGSGFVAQVAHVKGMQVNVLADVDVEAARQAFMAVGWPADEIVEANTVNEAEDALQAGKKIITSSYALAAQLHRSRYHPLSSHRGGNRLCLHSKREGYRPGQHRSGRDGRQDITQTRQRSGYPLHSILRG